MPPAVSGPNATIAAVLALLVGGGAGGLAGAQSAPADIKALEEKVGRLQIEQTVTGVELGHLAKELEALGDDLAAHTDAEAESRDRTIEVLERVETALEAGG